MYIEKVENIVGHKTVKGKLLYQIRWKGYSKDSDTWEPEDTLSCPDIIQKYNEKVIFFKLIFLNLIVLYPKSIPFILE